MKNLKEIIIVTGLSGAGKTTVLKALEDLGYHCFDNFPLKLITNLIRIKSPSYREIKKIALGMDVRGKDFTKKFTSHLEMLKSNYSIKVIFVEASKDVLMNRYSETRRRHPLFEGNLEKALNKEKKLLEPVRRYANLTIDSSKLNVHDVKNITYHKFKTKNKLLYIHLISFGYKHGTPHDADIVFDVRFLPNPYFVKSLKNHTGLDHKVKKFVLEEDTTKIFLDHFMRLLDYTLPKHEAEGKLNLSIAIGCTGGKHRSVVTVEYLKDYFTKKNYYVKTEHRDLGKK